MSRSLYTQSLIRNANALTQDGSQKHWKYDWYIPSEETAQTPLTTTPSATPTPFGVEQTPKQPLRFQYKTWVENEEYTAIEDGPEDDILDLSLYNRFSSNVQKEPENSLTAADIRGAVGGEAIAGFSSSDAAKKERAADVAEEKPEVETAGSDAMDVDAKVEEAPQVQSEAMEIDSEVTAEKAELVTETVAEKAEPVAETAEPVAETAEPVAETATETVAEPVAEPATEPVVETVAETVAEPVAETPTETENTQPSTES